MLPSFTTSNLFISEAACSDQDSLCPLPKSNTWSGKLGDWSWMNSTQFDASSWDISLEPLKLTGQATLISDRVTLQSQGQEDAYLDFIANSVDQNYTVNFPSSNVWYTMDTGFFSLNGDSAHVNYTSGNGTEVSLNTTLPLAHTKGVIPSISYGLHMGSGSVDTPIPGSLVLGGYDRTRCLTDPIISTNGNFVLTSVGLGVAQGASPFPSSERLPVNNLLRSNGSATKKLVVYPNPGVPYLNLPSDTCAAIAEMLPLTFDTELGLYLWNTSNPAFKDIVSSPAYLSFTFESMSTETNTIYVPFALLNLTLDYPLVKTKTQYFPCSPYNPADGSTYHLGRAFLQAAFLAQNWQTRHLMLAQAPGPDMDDEYIVTIAANDTSISSMVNAPLWNSTWSSKLKALPMVEETTDHPSSKLSGGAIAGIVVGVLALLAIVIALLFWRRRAKTAQRTEDWTEMDHESLSFHPSTKIHDVAETWTSANDGTGHNPVEMDTAFIRELDGTPVHEKDTCSK